MSTRVLSQPSSEPGTEGATARVEAAARTIRILWLATGRQPWLVVFRNPYDWENRYSPEKPKSWRHRLLHWILERQPDGFRHVVLIAPMGEKPDGRRMWLRIDPQSTGVQVAAVLDGGLDEDLSAGRVLVATEDRPVSEPRFWGAHCCANHVAAILKRRMGGLWVTPKALHDRLLSDGACMLYDICDAEEPDRRCADV